MGQTEQIALPCDRRYRTNRYFLQDQLRCSEAISDFRSVKQLLSSTPAFSGASAFRFRPEPVAVRTH
jgi:hypothetical protein